MTVGQLQNELKLIHKTERNYSAIINIVLFSPEEVIVWMFVT